MKLAVRNISTSESHVTGIAIIDKNPLWAAEVCVDRVDGKSIEQYESELLAKARERIAEIYKEIVCGGELDEEIIIPLCGKLSGKFNIRVVNKNGKLSVSNLDGGESDQLGCLGGKIEPTEFSCKMKVAINDDATNKDLEERIAALEEFATGITRRFNLYTLK
ncbi:hypothetical protein AXA88_27175 [Salmonella enterica]|nr:hypothetical protein [Salmonella enterica]EAX3609497.1 hypothetical protein [Salmonella enterica]EGW6283045.1 hypothetical protein [Salmonella enterica]EGX3935470.1 hypothetical protein [Salmonella enterica]